MHIIILEGNKKAGKTPTLQMVYAVLKLLNARVRRRPQRITTGNIRDFEAVLSFQNKTVAIFTGGDFQKDCYNAINKYAKQNVDVLILAHTSLRKPLNTAPHTSVIVKKTVPPNKFEEMSSHIADCLNIIIRI